jgi:hypothetical protein
MNSIPIQNGDGTIKRVVKPTESTNISPMFVGTPGYTWKIYFECTVKQKNKLL